MPRQVPIPSLTAHALSTLSGAKGFDVTPNSFGLTILDILHLRHFLLAHGLPRELIAIIFDYSDIWILHSIQNNQRVIVKNETTASGVGLIYGRRSERMYQAEKSYLITPMLPNCVEFSLGRQYIFSSPSRFKFPTKIKQIKFTVISRCETFLSPFSWTKSRDTYLDVKVISALPPNHRPIEQIWPLPMTHLFSPDDCIENVIIWEEDQTGQWGVGFVQFLNTNPASKIEIIVGAVGMVLFTHFVYSVKIDVYTVLRD